MAMIRSQRPPQFLGNPNGKLVQAPVILGKVFTLGQEFSDQDVTTGIVKIILRHQRG